VSTPPVTRHGATLRSGCVSMPPVTGRTASTVVTLIPSAWEVLRDGAAAQQRGGGAIALLAQGDPPRYGAVLAPHQPGPGRQIVPKTGAPSADSRAKPEPKRGRQYTLYRPQCGGLSPITRSTSLHILPAESERRIAALATLPAERRSAGYGAGRGAARVAAGRRRSLPRLYGQALAAGDVYTVAGTARAVPGGEAGR